MYRIEDSRALAEMQVLVNREGEVMPSRFILETDQIQFGSFSAAGMWKYIGMDTLLSSSALKDSPGLKADRSSRYGLENPGLSFSIPEKGGILCIASEHQIQSSLWSSFNAGPYSSLHTGLSFILPDANTENRTLEDWYPETGIAQYSPLYHSVSEIRIERAKVSFRVLTALSAASFRIPGFSILPSLFYYGSVWDLSSRFWFNTEHWLNSHFERTDSLFHSENLVTVKLISGFHARVKWSSNIDYNEETPLTHGLQGRADLLWKAWPLLFEYNLIPPDFSSAIEQWNPFYNHSYRVQAGWNGSVWSSRAEGTLLHDKYKIQQLKGAAELKRGPRKGRYSRFRCTLISDPGIMRIKPVHEEVFFLGTIRFKISGGYEFKIPSGSYDPDSLSLSLSMEWKGF